LEKYYPPAVHQKAAKLEQLLLRLETGEELAPLCAELGLELTPKRVQKLQAKYEAGGRQTAALLDGRFGHSQHVTSAIRAYLYERRQTEPEITGPALAAEVGWRFEVTVSVGHINHLLDEMAMNRRTGRPRKAVEPQPEPSRPPGQANAGLFFPGGGETGPGRDGDA
jgi:hypothetical protein